MVTRNGKIRKPKNRTTGHIYGGWIKYQLDLIGVSNTDIAEKIEVRDNATTQIGRASCRERV